MWWRLGNRSYRRQRTARHSYRSMRRFWLAFALLVALGARRSQGFASFSPGGLKGHQAPWSVQSTSSSTSAPRRPQQGRSVLPSLPAPLVVRKLWGIGGKHLQPPLQQQQHKHVFDGGNTRSRAVRCLQIAAAVIFAGARRANAFHAPVPSGEPLPPLSPKALLYRVAIWFFLFMLSAAFHSAEIAITTLYPWKVKEFAEEEGEKSPFQILNKDITRVSEERKETTNKHLLCLWVQAAFLTCAPRPFPSAPRKVLTTILVATTICTIYSAALFTNLCLQVSSIAMRFHMLVLAAGLTSKQPLFTHPPDLWC